MKRTLLLQSVLLGAMMLLAAPAWAQETENTVMFFFENPVNPFTDNARITSAIEYDEVRGSNVLGWTCANNAQNGYAFSYFDFSDALVENTEEVQISFKYYNVKGGRSILTIGDAGVRGETGGSSKNTYNSSGAFFRIGSDMNNAFICNENYSQDDICNQWLYVNVVVYLLDKEVYWDVHNESFSFHKAYTGEYYSDDARTCSQIDVFGYVNNAHCGMIDDLMITCLTGTCEYANYTIRYVDMEENELKPSRIASGAVDHPVEILPSDKESFYSEDGTKKYILEDIDEIGMPVEADGSTVVTLYFREAETYYATLYCMTNGSYELLNRLTGTFFEGDELTLYPSRGYGKDGKYYFAAATNSWNGITYTFPRNITPSVVGGKTTYLAILFYEEDKTVAYYSDFERLALPTQDEGNGTGLGQLVGTVNNWWSFFGEGVYFDRFSGGRSIRLDANSYVWTEPVAEDGTYMVRIYGRNDKSANCEQPYALGYRDTEGNVTIFDVAVPGWVSATTGESIVGSVEEAAGVGIKAGWSLVVKNTGGGNMISLDDIKLTKVADYAETPKASAYTVAGAYVVEGSEEHSAAFFGTAWDPTQNEMTANGDGTYSKKFENVTFEQTGTIYYKVAVNYDWEESYGFDGNNADYWVYVPADGKRIADVVFSFNPETKAVSCTLVDKNPAYTAYFINTEDWAEVYVWAWNQTDGIHNVYESWPGTPATKTDNKVDGHDVYVWSYTGPIVPTMIIFNNGGNGVQTPDFEFVNGGVYNSDGVEEPVVYTEFVEETGTLTYYYDGKRVSRSGVTDIYDPADLNAPRFEGYSDKVLKAVIDPSMQEAELTSFESMFCGSWNDETHRFNNLSQMTTVEGLENLNTVGVMSTCGMFANCEALTSLDFSSFNTSYITQMDQMFLNCQSLTSLDLSMFNTEQVMRLEAMFYHCDNLQIVDVSSFDIGNVYSMASMFAYCSKLTTICCFSDWSGTEANSSNMFGGCTALVGGMGTKYNGVTDATYARPDGGEGDEGYFTAPVAAPEDLVTEPYNFKGFDTYYEKDDFHEVQVGFYGENKVYIQGLSDYLPDAWVVGTFEDGVVTIPMTYLGIYDDYYDDFKLFFSGATFVYDAAAETFTSAEGYQSYIDEYWWDSYKDVVLTKLYDIATTPADPEIIGFKYLDTKYPYVVFSIPLVSAIDGRPIMGNKLAYQLFYYKNDEVTPLVLTTDLYEDLNADISEIPYYFSDSWDVYHALILLRQPIEEIDSWHMIGIQSIYYGGGECHKSNLVWWNNETADGISPLLTSPKEEGQVYNLAGQRLNKMQKGINIVGGKKILVK